VKKQLSDQQFHDRRYQERKRAEAAKRMAPKRAARDASPGVNPQEKEITTDSVKPSN
jgi:hypothetical protein